MQWRIFFIGPMQRGATADDAPGYETGDTSERSRDHFDQMVEAVSTGLRRYGYAKGVESTHILSGGKEVPSRVFTRLGDGDEVTLIQPHELFGANSISTNVFDAIDDADLIIADLSDVRPAVIYELALAHALGIWTILLTSASDAQLMFYLSAYRHAMVDFGAESVESKEFTSAFTEWLEKRNKRFDSGNPFTDFYGAPIPDISAASGLASGYFENFLSRVLAAGAELVDRRDESAPQRLPIAGVLVVKPANLRDLGDIVDDTATALELAFGDRFRRGERGKVYVDTHGFGDRTCEFVVDTWLIDVPRTLLTLERSPRLRRTATKDERQRAHDELAGVLILRFLEVARRALEDDRDIKRKKQRFFYGTPDEIVRYIEAEPKARPSVW